MSATDTPTGRVIILPNGTTRDDFFAARQESLGLDAPTTALLSPTMPPGHLLHLGGTLGPTAPALAPLVGGRTLSEGSFFALNLWTNAAAQAQGQRPIAAPVPGLDHSTSLRFDVVFACLTGRRAHFVDPSVAPFGAIQIWNEWPMTDVGMARNIGRIVRVVVGHTLPPGLGGFVALRADRRLVCISAWNNMSSYRQFITGGQIVHFTPLNLGIGIEEFRFTGTAQ